MCPKDVDGLANGVDPHQTAPRAVWSGSSLFAYTCLSKNFGSLRYFVRLESLTVAGVFLEVSGSVTYSMLKARLFFNLQLQMLQMKEHSCHSLTTAGMPWLTQRFKCCFFWNHTFRSNPGTLVSPECNQSECFFDILIPPFDIKEMKDLV